MLSWLVGCAEDPAPSPAAPTEPLALPEDCSALPDPDGTALSPGDDLAAAVRAASPGDTVIIGAGTWEIDEPIVVEAQGLTIRGSGEVVLDGLYATGPLLHVGAADVTIAELGVRQSWGDAIVVAGVSGARLHGLRVEETEGNGVLIEAWADDGVVGCSAISGAVTGIDAVQARGWRVFGNTVEGSDDAGIRFWTGSRDTVVERNVVTGGLVGIALGDLDYGEGEERLYDDAPCPELGQAGHYGGIARNNVTSGASLAGLRVEEACDTTVAHNTVLDAPLDWRSTAGLVIWNNLATLAGEDADVAGNLEPVESDLDGVHLREGAAAIDAGAAIEGIEEDIDREARDALPDVGADEWVSG